MVVMMAIKQFIWIRHILLFWIIFLLTQDSGFAADTVYRVDPLALLSATLTTYQKAGCDSEYLSLSCPRGTKISIEVAQYGKSGGDGTEDNICPSTTDNVILDRIHSGTEIEIKTPESCLWPNALQYNLVQTVVEACQKKTHCKFISSPRSFRGDPCPGVRRFVEINYKCRPDEFRSKVACENDVIQLICNPYSRIAIYSASYGRTEYESIQCSQPQGVREETCLVSYATETVMQICHGRRKCNLSADSTTFGKPCRPDSRMYLKVVYTCVPRKVLRDKYDSQPEPDEPHQIELEHHHDDDIYDEDQFYRESEAIPPAPKLQSGMTKDQRPSNTTIIEITSSIEPPIKTRDGNSLEARTIFPINKIQNTNYSRYNDCSSEPCIIDGRAIEFIGYWINFNNFLTQNQERFYIYLIISVTAGIILCLLLVLGRLLVHKIRTKDEAKFHTSNTGETSLPNGFSDDISEIDADIDLTTPLPIPSVTRNDQNYGAYNPSIGPYTKMGPPMNIPHATPMLVPSSCSSILSVPSSTVNRPGTMMISTQSMNSPMGTLALQHMSTLPHRSIQPNYLSGSIVGHGTLRRPQQTDIDQTIPRSLTTRSADNAQYYYG